MSRLGWRANGPIVSTRTTPQLKKKVKKKKTRRRLCLIIRSALNHAANLQRRTEQNVLLPTAGRALEKGSEREAEETHRFGLMSTWGYTLIDKSLMSGECLQTAAKMTTETVLLCCWSDVGRRVMQLGRLRTF